MYRTRSRQGFERVFDKRENQVILHIYRYKETVHEEISRNYRSWKRSEM